MTGYAAINEAFAQVRAERIARDKRWADEAAAKACPTCTTLRAKLQSATADALAIDGQAMELMAENARLRTALAAVSRATTLMEAAQIAEAALRGDVGTATQDVVEFGSERTQA